ncbi:CubicO group peptidase, beta-lactamase class C family [Zobellia uliginosa]|uniref:CubicO group peptidase, beta-lactamase class C family n=1 Tax=Zobellia uliginosa TaxID=143224 RepID=A0ABY1KUQ3_9FLAO|nr:serine hydrolase domain-containing protein [Zobellia uliginosa]SIS81247.1 CubicO group peptidase, beta-lactamase class C family [Zobellia uliginosa]
MKRTTFTSVLLLLMGLSVFCQESNFNKLDSLFNHLESHDRFMGSLALSENGKTIYSRSIGYADIDAQQEIDEKTKFRIGSITKMFTSVLTFMAIEEGKISLDQPIADFFPNIKNATSITIGNLLNHRSGIANVTSRPDYLLWNTQPKTRQQLLELIEQGGSVFEPNSKGEYSNSNYQLLTFILEDVLKDSYANLIKTKITEPLQLKNTYMGSPIDPNNHEAFSYNYDTRWNKSFETHMSIPIGAGAIVSTPTDLNTFSTALHEGKLITNKSLKQMKTFEDGYGMGLFEMPYFNKKGFGHNGGIDGFTSQLATFPKDHISVALISNGTRYSNNDILIAVLAAYYDKSFNIPHFETIEVTAEDLEKYLGIYGSKQLHLKLTITENEGNLTAQATGQPSFPLEAVEEHAFEFHQAGVRLEFNPKENTMLLKQGGNTYMYTRE